MLTKDCHRPHQTAYLLKHNILPLSIDYRLCPEINLIDGPITDTRDAYAWIKSSLQPLLQPRGITIDASRNVVIGWSTGGHLAMTTAWTSVEIGLEPPVGILSFYGPTDFESGGTLDLPFAKLPPSGFALACTEAKLTSNYDDTLDLDICRAEMYPERRLSMDKIIASLPSKPVCPSPEFTSHLYLAQSYTYFPSRRAIMRTSLTRCR